MPILIVNEPRSAGRTRVDRASSAGPPTEDFHEELARARGARASWIVQRVPERRTIEVPTKYGRPKKIPIERHLAPQVVRPVRTHPRLLDLDLLDDAQARPTTTTTPATRPRARRGTTTPRATSNAAAQAAVGVRNFAAGLRDRATSRSSTAAPRYGHYKEVRERADRTSGAARRGAPHHGQARQAAGHARGDRPLLRVGATRMRDEIAERQVRDLVDIAATVHPACHYYKLVAEDAIYDPDALRRPAHRRRHRARRRRSAPRLRDYSTWFDCCGFGFRHILVPARLHPILRHHAQDRAA